MPSSCGVRGEEGGGLNSGLLVTNRDAEKNLFLCDWTWEMVQKCKYACENSHGVPALCENFTQKLTESIFPEATYLRGSWYKKASTHLKIHTKFRLFVLGESDSLLGGNQKCPPFAPLMSLN